MTAILTCSVVENRWGREYQPTLAKTCTDGQWADFGNATYFDMLNFEPQSMDELHTILADLEKMPWSCLVRGRAKAEGPRQQRLLHSVIEPVRDGLSWLMVDVDKIPVPALDTEEEYLDFITSQLPACFHDVTYYYQWSSKAFMDREPETLSVHLFYWLAEPRSCQNLKARIDHPEGDWHGYPIDSALFTPNQIHYTSPPIFRDARGNAVADHLERRSGVMLGLSDVVEVRPWVAPIRSPMAAVAAQGASLGRSIPDQLATIGEDGHIHAHARRICWDYIRTVPRMLRDREKLIWQVADAVDAALANRPEKERRSYYRRDPDGTLSVRAYIERMYESAVRKFET